MARNLAPATPISLQTVLALFLMCVTLVAPMHARAQAPSEYQLKAVFLFRFADFVQWPPNAFSSPQSPIVFGLLGPNPFGDALQQAIQGETVSGRSLVITQFQRFQDVRQCHVLFISREQSSQIATITARLRGQSILTVSDSPNFIAEGGIIQFVTEGSRVRFRINRSAAEADGLKLSSKLLRISEQ